ncbi:MAG: ABC transporter substrate-binding protein, partial [Chloroflexi bacterium]|nr:ABC transporter substrate-binding protein [Chloroflexota bacterium]
MMRRPTLVRLAALVLVALAALAACTSKKDRKAAAAEELKLKIGVLFTTSGEGGDLAQAVLGATKLAADDAKKDKVTIEFVQADYAGDPKQVRKAIDQLKGTDAIVVGTPDPVVLPVLAEITDVPVIHTLITRDGVADAGNVFALAPASSLQAEKLADYLVNTRKYRRIVIITDTTSFGREGRDALDRALGDLGVTPRLSLEFAPGGDIHTPVAHAGQVGADAAILWVFNP